MTARSGDLRRALRVTPGTAVTLADVDPAATHGHQKADAGAATIRVLERLAGLQERLWAEHHHKVLIVLQGIDAAGKGGTIEHVMGAFNPAGATVTSFKVPTEPERDHDYLWRVHQHTPGSGRIAIFDRSHYEEVLIVRVHHLVSKDVWSRRYDQINAFEQMLTEEGTTILKFFLYIDRDEQRERFQARYDDPTKRWKFRVGDLDERKRWDDYIAAFEEMLWRTSTPNAPWYLVPANRKWFRNFAVATIVADTLEDLAPAYPIDPTLPAGLIIE
jgi:PPK2 family polyphosphate:nucleotide phosphotransferase